MSSPLLRPVRSHSGAPTFVAQRRNGGPCLAHRVEPGWVESIEALRGLRHPHLASTLGIATLDDEPHALVELRPAEPLGRLRDRLARAGRAGLPVPVMVRVAAQVADAAAALHARGLAHGSIDARRVAITYAGEALLLDTPVCVPRGAAPGDDIAAVGRLLDALCVDTPVALLDLARRAREGAIERASDLSAALMAWRQVDPKASAVDAAQVARWMSRVCAARLEVWRSIGETIDRRSLDAIVALVGPPRAAPRPWDADGEADTAAPVPAPPAAPPPPPARPPEVPPGETGGEPGGADAGGLDDDPVDIDAVDDAIDGASLDDAAPADEVGAIETEAEPDDPLADEPPWHWPRIVLAVSILLAVVGAIGWWLFVR